MKKLFLLLIMFVALIGCSKNGQKNVGEKPENAKVDTVLLYDDQVTCMISVNGLGNEKELTTYDVVMNMDNDPELAREYYVKLKTAEPIVKAEKITYDDLYVQYVVKNYDNTIDTMTIDELRGKYLTSEQRDAYLEVLGKINK